MIKCEHCDGAIYLNDVGIWLHHNGIPYCFIRDKMAEPARKILVTLITKCGCTKKIEVDRNCGEWRVPIIDGSNVVSLDVTTCSTFSTRIFQRVDPATFKEV